jgi:hypothetical protein
LGAVFLLIARGTGHVRPVLAHLSALDRRLSRNIVLRHDLDITQRSRAGAALARAATLVLLLLSGCQNNNSQRDLVARELRMQEDRIYAMEDYINEYQQLLCKFRSENAALKRQLAEDCTIVETPDSSTSPRSKSSGGEGSRVVSPAPTLEAPEVPPLEPTKPDGANLQFRPGNFSGKSESGEQPSDVAAASYSAPAGETALPAAVIPKEPMSSAVQLWGEVLANDMGGGPRLAIQLAPHDGSSGAQVLVGHVSLMLLAIDEQGSKQNLGRWDFGPEETQAAVDPTSGILLFNLELPAETPVTTNNELWVRVVPQEGGKLLAKASVDLVQPGAFASRVEQPPQAPKIAAQIADAAGVDTVLPASYTMSTAGDDGWQLARPGEPANLPTETEALNGGWRAATQPLPDVVAQKAPAEPSLRANRPKREPETATVSSTGQKAAWSPDRPGEAAKSTTASDGATQRRRPRWSATR